MTVLRSGRILDNGEIVEDASEPRVQEEEVVVEDISHEEDEVVVEDTRQKEEEVVVPPAKEAPRLHKSSNPYIPPIPYPGRLKNTKLEQSFQDIYDILSKVNVNLPLLDAIQKMPSYAKFFKELNKDKIKFKPRQQERLGENVSAVIQKKLPQKMKDPGGFIINISIGGGKQEKAMLDLGASINLMPYTIYKRLGLNDLKTTSMSLLLADQSSRLPLGIIEDVLIQVEKLIIPADFVVLDMEGQRDEDQMLLLGRPFMATARAIVDVHDGKLTMKVLDEVIEFKLFESGAYPIGAHDSFHVNSVDTIIEEESEEFLKKKLDVLMASAMEFLEEQEEDNERVDLMEELVEEESINEIEEVGKGELESTLATPPRLELKELPTSLKYAYLDEEERKPVIVSSELNQDEETRLLEVLRVHKAAIGWSIEDIKGISPTICMHKIH
jgi:hypothetical protein